MSPAEIISPLALPVAAPALRCIANVAVVFVVPSVVPECFTNKNTTSSSAFAVAVSPSSAAPHRHGLCCLLLSDS